MEEVRVTFTVDLENINVGAGGKMKVDLFKNDTIADVKVKLEEKFGLEKESLIIKFGAEILPETTLLGEADLSDVHLSGRARPLPPLLPPSGTSASVPTATSGQITVKVNIEAAYWKLEVCISPSATFAGLKAQIASKLKGVKESEMMILVDGQAVGDDEARLGNLSEITLRRISSTFERQFRVCFIFTSQEGSTVEHFTVASAKDTIDSLSQKVLSMRNPPHPPYSFRIVTMRFDPIIMELGRNLGYYLVADADAIEVLGSSRT